MELESGSSSVDRWDHEAGGARATTAPARWAARVRSGRGAGGSIGRSTHTTPESWATTSTKTPARTVPQAHEVSKPHVGWRVGAPRGSVRQSSPRHSADTSTSRGSEAQSSLASWSRSVVGAGVTGAGEQGPRESHAGGPARVREKPRLPDAHEAARENVLDEAAEKLHGRERHRATRVAMGVVLVVKVTWSPSKASSR